MSEPDTRFVGYVDSVVGNKISGWAKCGDESGNVDLLVNNSHVLTVPATRFRADLVGIASADGKRAFIIVVPQMYCDGVIKSLSVRFSGTDTPLTSGEFDFSHVFAYESAVIVTKPDPKLAKRAKEILSLLRPQDVIGGQLIRRGRDNDGGYVMLNFGLENTSAYSLGINDDVSWDLEMAELGCQLFQYDHTIDALPYNHPSFRWFKIGIAGVSSPSGVFKSLDELIILNEHNNNDNLILKMDIEGSEWDVLKELPRETIDQFSQIVAEFHCFTAIDDQEYFENIAGALKKINLTHQLVHIHANNCGKLGFIGGVPLPDALEVSYVRRNDHDFAICSRVFPTEMDMPCNPDAADFYLGPMGYNEYV